MSFAKSIPLRSAWVEVNLGQLRRNFELINADKPAHVRLLSVVKDNGYGHGAVAVARVAAACGVRHFAVITLEEAMQLRAADVPGRIMLLGERQPEEIPFCIEHDLEITLGDLQTAGQLSREARAQGRTAVVHVKVDTGMSRYGIRWSEAPAAIATLAKLPALRLEGLMSHFAQSDEADKTFALLQLARFREVEAALTAQGIAVRYRQHCNSGGLLDLPQAHFDMARLGILPLGVFPSQACRRIAGIQPVMTVKARVATLKNLQPGDYVGYGMRYQAASPRRIAVLPIGYGDGFPRVRNQGHVLLHGCRAPLVGGVAMDAITVDVTEIPETQLWDEAVVMGAQAGTEISVHEVAQLKGSVSYDVLTGWRARLPRVYREAL